MVLPLFYYKKEANSCESASFIALSKKLYIILTLHL